MTKQAKASLPRALFDKVQVEVKGGKLKDFNSASDFIAYATRQALQSRGLA